MDAVTKAVIETIVDDGYCVEIGYADALPVVAIDEQVDGPVSRRRERARLHLRRLRPGAPVRTAEATVGQPFGKRPNCGSAIREGEAPTASGSAGASPFRRRRGHAVLLSRKLFQA